MMALTLPNRPARVSLALARRIGRHPKAPPVPSARAPSSPRVALGAHHVQAWMYKLVGQDSWEIASAIAKASNDDPLWTDPDGVRRTAVLLIAMAAVRSGFHPSKIGEQGKAFGLYQIMLDDPEKSADPLLLPLTASYVAIELVRQAIETEPNPIMALAWYDRSRSGQQKAAWILMMARDLFRMALGER